MASWQMSKRPSGRLGCHIGSQNQPFRRVIMNNKKTRITKVAVNADNEIVGYSGRSKVDGWPLHAQAPKKAVNQLVKQLEEEIKTETLTLEVFGEMFDTFDEEMSDEFGFEADDEEGEEPEEGDEEGIDGMRINADYKAKYAQHNDSCGDELANVLHEVVTIQVPRIGKDGKQNGTKDSCSPDAMAKIAKANGIIDRYKGWSHLNVGHIRMILRNTLFAMINRGEEVVVGKKTWKENKKLQEEVVEKRKKTAKKFAELKKKSANKAKKAKAA